MVREKERKILLDAGAACRMDFLLRRWRYGPAGPAVEAPNLLVAGDANRTAGCIACTRMGIGIIGAAHLIHRTLIFGQSDSKSALTTTTTPWPKILSSATLCLTWPQVGRPHQKARAVCVQNPTNQWPTHLVMAQQEKLPKPGTSGAFSCPWHGEPRELSRPRIASVLDY